MTDTNNAEMAVNEASVSETTSDTTSSNVGTSWIPSEYTNDPSITKFKDTSSLVKSYKHLESRLGSSIVIPSKDAGAEELAAFKEKLTGLPKDLVASVMDKDTVLKQLGKPSKEEDYTFMVPEDSGITQEQANALAKEAFELGLTNDQAQALMDKRIKLQAQVSELSKQASKKSEEFLKEKFGAAYEDRMAAAQSALELLKQNFGEHVEQLETSGALSNPAIVAILSDLGQAAQEKTLHGTLKQTSYHLTPEYAKSQMEMLQKDREFMDAYMSALHPEHNAAVEKMSKFIRLSLGTK